VCEPECPASAIKADTDEEGAKWVEFNDRYAQLWPVITTVRDPLPNAEANDGVPDKLATMFIETPANETEKSA